MFCRIKESGAIGYAGGRDLCRSECDSLSFVRDTVEKPYRWRRSSGIDPRLVRYEGLQISFSLLILNIINFDYFRDYPKQMNIFFFVYNNIHI